MIIVALMCHGEYSFKMSFLPCGSTVGMENVCARGLHWLGVDGESRATAVFPRVCVHTLRESRVVGFNVTGIPRVWNGSPARILSC